MLGLFAKEFREHGLAFLMFAVFEVGLFLLILLMFYFQPGRGSYFYALRGWLSVGAVLGCFYLGHRLIAREFGGKTQLFLACLPVRRSSIFLTKWLTGLMVLLGVTLVCGAICVVVAAAGEVFSARYVALMGVRTLAFLLFIYSFAMAVGFLGRYRILALIWSFLVFGVIDNTTALDLGSEGPLALVFNEMFVFEQRDLPLGDLIMALAGAAAFYATSMLMMLTREGSVAAMLAHKMTHREKIFLASMTVILLAAIVFFDEANDEKPYELNNAVVSQTTGASVHISPSPDHSEEVLQALATTVCHELEAMRVYLGMQHLTPVFLTLRNDLAPGIYERGDLSGATGFLARLRYDEDDFDLRRFAAWLIPGVLQATTHHRVDLEPNRWLLDGFGLFFAYRNLDEAAAKQLTLRALYGAPQNMAMRHLDQWLLLREKVGEHIAQAIAWHGLEHLAQRSGPEACQALLARKLGLELPPSYEAMVYEWKHPLDQELQKITGLTYQQFLDSWQSELAAQRQAYAAELAQIQSLEGDLKVFELGPMTRRIEFRLTAPANLTGSRVAFRYVVFQWLGDEVDPDKAIAEEMPAEQMRAKWQELGGTFGRGTRIAWTFSMPVDVLGCDVISGWTREALP